MELKTKIWMNGNLEWFALINEDDMYLGKREVPIPLEEGDEWINDFGDKFKIENSEIIHLGRFEPPQKYW